MARVETIIVGGGIGAGSPFELNFVPIIGSVDPPLLISTDFLFTVPTGATRGLIVGTTDPDATATERLRVSEGFISEGVGVDSFVAGRGAVAGGTDNISIGRGANSGTALDTIVIGAGNNDNTTGQGCILIGNNITKSATQGSVVAIGNNLNVLGAGTCINGNMTAVSSTAGICIQGTIQGTVGGVALLGTITAGANVSSVAIIGQASGSGGVIAIGDASVASGAGSIAIGRTTTASASESLAIGFSATSTHVESVALGGSSTTFAANQIVIGNSASRINTVSIGGDTDSAPVSCTWRLANGTGTNIAGGHFIVQPGLSTGNAVPGQFRVNMGTALASGTTLQTAATRLQVSEGAAGETWLHVYDVDNNALERVTVGAADSGGLGFKLLRIPN